jgi:spermidine synthase
MPLLAGLYTSWAGTAHRASSSAGLAAAICLLPPTILMGATLPAISRWVKSSPDGVAWLGYFYGGNIAGGVVVPCWRASTCCACTTWRSPPTSLLR